MPGCRRPTRCLLLLLLAIAMLTAAAAQSVAQTYPARPVTIITPFAAGSQTDAAARLLASHLQDALGQTFVVENKAGAGGLIAANTQIVNTLAGTMRNMLERSQVRERFEGAGVQVVWSGPREFADFVKAELAKWTAAIKEAGIEPE
jgi:tripartite-type tricarboxylate transporter receptor subunit TctC